MVTVPSLVAAVAAPVVPVLVGAVDRRLLLLGLMTLMTLANVTSALAPDFAVLVTSRVLVGVAIGGFWAVAGGLAVRLVSTENVPRATAIVFAGVGAANVLGVPLGTLLGDLTDCASPSRRSCHFTACTFVSRPFRNCRESTNASSARCCSASAWRDDRQLRRRRGAGARDAPDRADHRLAFGGVSVGLQTWMIKAAPQTVEAASSLWVAVFNP